MPSLENRVAQQRDTLMGYGPRIRLHRERALSRLRHPVVLIPAFLGGMLVARIAPVLVRLTPRVTARVGHFRKEVRQLDAIVRLITSLLPMLPRLSGSDADETGRRPPPT
ncbi:hypothetical protein DES49_1869 [Halospina denitrificans]|uniref:Uncharacterized protein n=1 Tax=Halospina denitrificans TaxID=332522 RepID=A0A4R7JW81_9GAMM|nr:hypothetical protein [Halospina denitrificans]TDT41767.1 hypothetical protein DES49_1869 [Halospina denitrificans]